MSTFFVLFIIIILGAIVGSFLNVCIYRIPREKSILWPGSHCGHCLQPVQWYDNIPLLSYWLLRGRCRQCGTPFSMRYFFVELLTGVAFAGLFYLEAMKNVHHLAVFKEFADNAQETGFMKIDPFLIPPAAWGFLIFHQVLAAFLIVVSFCDLDLLEIPFSITLTGTVVGIICGTILWMHMPASGDVVAEQTRLVNPPDIHGGVYAWPVWLSPLPRWLASPVWWTGLATALAGTLAGMLVLRGVRFVFQLGRGVEGMGIGDADIMMMAGAFIGWQPIIISFFIGVFVALIFGIAQLVMRGNQMMPFGPSLAIGVLVTMLAWQGIGPKRFDFVFFDSAIMLMLLIGGGVLLLIISFAVRLLRHD
jgi:leader peptidase (prepilin peptidase)/N-methyltransferase